jgi:FtsH-binding integral membrane protein
MPNPFGSNNVRPFDFASSEPANPAVVRFFNSVYAWMAVGLTVTALVALGVAQTDLWQTFARMWWLLLIVEVGLVMVIAGAVNKINAAAATGLFLLYSALNGLTLSVIFIVFTHASLVACFVVSAGMFGTMSVYGMVTKRDLTRLGSLLRMALIGLVIAMLVSMFYHPSGLVVAINFIGVLVFVGLTAYDTQKLKYIANQTIGDERLASRMTVVGSLVLYLDFINLFLFLLQFMGDRRRS